MAAASELVDFIGIVTVYRIRDVKDGSCVAEWSVMTYQRGTILYPYELGSLSMVSDKNQCLVFYRSGVTTIIDIDNCQPVSSIG